MSTEGSTADELLEMFANASSSKLGEAELAFILVARRALVTEMVASISTADKRLPWSFWTRSIANRLAAVRETVT